MKVTLSITIYNRSDLLEKTLEALLVTYPCGADEVLLYSDGASEDVLIVARNYCNKFPHVSLYQAAHVGIPVINNVAMAKARGNDLTIMNDVIIRSDSDFYVSSAGWTRKLAQFLADHHEVGIAAPDWAGRYMRINRPDYDEIEYAMGAIMACRGEVYDLVSQMYGAGFFDREIGHQWDPDVCYRARMLGYRIAVTPVGDCIDLGAGTGDSAPPVLTKSTSPVMGGFQFLRKWNLYFTGQFCYKSPMMLRWDEFPLNYLWRRMWLAQFKNPDVNAPENVTVADAQWHKFEWIKFPITPGKWLLPETREALQKNLVFKGEDNLRDTDLDLLTGKRGWTPADLQHT